MNPDKTANVTRTVLLSLWGVATLVLLFCLAILVYEMVQKGEDPLDVTFLQQPADSAAAPDGVRDAVIAARLYFADASSNALAAEDRTIPVTEYTAENCKHAIEALAAGPRSDLLPVLPPETKVRAAYLLEDGELVVDFSRDLELALPRSVLAEWLMVRAVVNTVTQNVLVGTDGGRVTKVRFLFEGLAQSAFPTHVDLSQPVVADIEWGRLPGNA